MQDEIKVWLEDIEKAISEINDFLPEPRNFSDFDSRKRNPSAKSIKLVLLGSKRAENKLSAGPCMSK